MLKEILLVSIGISWTDPDETAVCITHTITYCISDCYTLPKYEWEFDKLAVTVFGVSRLTFIALWLIKRVGIWILMPLGGLSNIDCFSWPKYSSEVAYPMYPDMYNVKNTHGW